MDILGWLVVVTCTRDGGIAGVAKVLDGSCSFCILIFIGKKWLVSIVLANNIPYPLIQWNK